MIMDQPTRMLESTRFGFSSMLGNCAYCRSLHKERAHVRCKRGQRVIVATGPATEAAVIATKPLSKDDLIQYFVSGCKPKDKWRIGTEHEKFGFECATLRPIKYKQIAALLNGIAERFDWNKIIEGDNIIGLRKGKQSISLEPGGQFELSGVPLKTLHQSCDEINSHLYQAKTVAEEMGIQFLGLGFQPKWRREDVPRVPKVRYDILQNYFHKFGLPGIEALLMTCSVQVNLDFSSEADMVRKLRASLALQPLAAALFANSPFTEGVPNGYLSIRSVKVNEVDKSRTGMLPFVFYDTFGFEQYVDYALDVPMVFVYRRNKYIDCSGMSFRDFMAGKLPAIPGELPTLNDWENHLTTIFPEVRLKRYMEMRGADGGPLSMLCALPAFWVGLLYDEVSLHNVLDMIADWTPQDRQILRNKVPSTGLKTPFQGRLLWHVAEDVLKWAMEGLERRCLNESVFLDPLKEVVETGLTPADKLLEKYHNNNNGSFIAYFIDNRLLSLGQFWKIEVFGDYCLSHWFWLVFSSTSLQKSTMVLISRTGSPHCMRSEIIRCKAGNNAFISSTRHKFDAFNVKKTCVGFSSLWDSASKTQLSQKRLFALVGGKRGHKVIVAASPPTEDAVVVTEPLTKKDLVDYLASGCKPKEKWRIGTEHEKFGFEFGSLRPMKYEQIAELLNGISERFDWDKVMEGDKIIGLKQGKQSISLEPGGQFELSGAPLETLHQTCAEVNSHLYQVKAVAEEMGIGFLGIGFQPKWGLKDIPIMPKGRYEIMRNYMPKVGSLGLDMMFRTCTVQVNLDFSSEADMIRKFRAGLALQPIATALFANSPFTEGKPNGFVSMRSQIWTDTDKDRTGMLPFVFDDSFGFEQYVDYALDVPMYFVYRKENYINCTGMTFRDFMAGKLPCIPGEFPTLNDWENHLTTIFPEVRLKRYLEMRGADGGPWRRLCALPAFWVGLLYDEVSLQSVLDMTADWTPEERHMLRNKVPRTGLKTPFRDGLLKHVAEDVLKLAKEGLERRGFKESGFLNEVAAVVRTGVTPAEKLLELYHGKWGQSVDPVFEELLY
ncbi:hypothetical protein L6164_019468 [Bauhinia variegata]|uniref:Uncharacterized protein n=1 Tax=Bauhinia variegata TaxID=167791 RepID=A0ACB9MT78_BAUVA|nr:hypothetical protein L6164_019468 [Bauhinia variegata]